MNIQAGYPSTPDEFVRWNEKREGRREFVDGRVVELMINTTIRHAVLGTRLASILLRGLPYPDFYVGTADVAVHTAKGVRYPDVFVDRGSPGHGDTGLVVEQPVLLAEVLSSSSLARDLLEKASEYTGSPSLLIYLVIAQDDARAWLWARNPDGSWPRHVEIAGTDEAIELAALGITIPMAELYAGIARGPGA